jgi:hypothetical protein
MSECLTFTNLWHIIVSAKLPIFSTNLVAPSVESPLSARANTARPLTSKTVVLAYCTGYLVVACQLKRPLNQTTQGLLSAFCSSKTTVIKFPTVYVLQKVV